MKIKMGYETLVPPPQQQPLARNIAIDEFPIDVLAEPRSARAKPADEIGRTDGVGARRRRREHLQALRTPGRDVHATGTARIKAGDKRRTEAENHDNAPRIARTGSHPIRPSLPRSHWLRATCDPLDSGVIPRISRRYAFHFARVISF
jgi:hypothetical protein